MIIDYTGILRDGVKHIIQQETWEFTKSLAHKGITYFSSANIATIEHSVIEAATLGEILFPNGKIHDELAGFLEIEKNGGIPNIISESLTQCADSLGINIDKAKGIAHCLEVVFVYPDTSIQDKLTRFNECHPMNPLEAVQVLGNVINLAKCLKDGISEAIHEL